MRKRKRLGHAIVNATSFAFTSRWDEKVCLGSAIRSYPLMAQPRQDCCLGRGVRLSVSCAPYPLANAYPLNHLYGLVRIPPTVLEQ
jgi:hypothetical protein